MAIATDRSQTKTRLSESNDDLTPVRSHVYPEAPDAGEREYEGPETQPDGRLPEAPDAGEVSEAMRDALAPFDRPNGENPYAIQHDLQAMMQDLVGIVRREDEMQKAREGLEKLKVRAKNAGVSGNREYNPGWHTALDLQHQLTVSEAILRAALERKESRGGHFRDDYPEKSTEFGGVNLVVEKDSTGAMAVRRVPIAPLPDELQRVIKENQ